MNKSDIFSTLNYNRCLDGPCSLVFYCAQLSTVIRHLTHVMMFESRPRKYTLMMFYSVFATLMTIKLENMDKLDHLMPLPPNTK